MPRTRFIAQWVPATDAKSAENSFFKINQSATPIDPTERRILKSRRSASAVAARAITHGGTGHKYWSNYAQVNQQKIEQAGAAIYRALYHPPISGEPLTTLDVPVAGRGYNALPFAFDLVNQCNGVNIADTTAKRDVSDELKDDLDGSETIKFLEKVGKRLSIITGDEPQSLGVHPVVYFYTRTGSFQPIALLATSRLLEQLEVEGKLKAFTSVRRKFEDFVIQHKEGISLLVHKFGTGGRSIPWIEKYYRRIVDGFLSGLDADAIQQGFVADQDFTFLTIPKPPSYRPISKNPKKPFSSGTKTAAY